MSMLGRLRTRIQRVLHDPDLPVYYAPQYRLPISSLALGTGLEPRRADFAAWALLELGAIQDSQLKTPPRVRYRDLCRVHTPELLESLMTAETLAHVFAVDAWDIPVDEVVHTIRLAVGGTLQAARDALERSGPAVNLLGGFHHAFPDKAGGMCPVNDIAVAIATLRAEGFEGHVVVLDLDAHPSDGVAACLADDPLSWLGSISGVEWVPLGGNVDDVVIPDADDETYLAALAAMLERMPEPDLAFVIAGGDVVAADHLGKLQMTPAGVRRRDRMVAAALDERPSVWVPGGGYSNLAWRLLAGTVLVLALDSERPIPSRTDPLSMHFSSIARRLDPARLRGGVVDEPWLTEDDLADALGLRPAGPPRLLGYYTVSGLEYALYRYGFTEQVRRIGYTEIRVAVDRVSVGDRMRVWGLAEGAEHQLVEGVYARTTLHRPRAEADAEGAGEDPAIGVPVLFVHWLTMTNPRGSFSAARPKLPGQEHPGLGIGIETAVMINRMAERLGLQGVVHRPAWYHVAYVGKDTARFVDPARQGRFEALLRDLAEHSLLESSCAIDEGRVLLNGQPYTWEPDAMVSWLGDPPWPEDEAAVAAAREAAHFTLVPAASPGADDAAPDIPESDAPT